MYKIYSCIFKYLTGENMNRYGYPWVFFVYVTIYLASRQNMYRYEMSWSRQVVYSGCLVTFKLYIYIYFDIL